nr:hypothetical protein [uncultured Pedobacter sp.]
MAIANKFTALVNKLKEAPKGIQMSDLFTENNPNGYFTREDLYNYIIELTEYQQKKFSLFFEYMTQGFPITSLPIGVEDKQSGLKVIWVRFKTPTGPQNFKMQYQEWLLLLVKHYISGVFKGVVFNEDEMVAEMLKHLDQ